MDKVTCKCAKCDAKLGTLANLWTQIGKKYLSPVDYPVDQEPFRISTSGAIRLGDADTLVGGCKLQDVECAACHVNLGQKCLTSPVNHVLDDGQVIFRIASIVIKSTADLRRKAEPKIKRLLSLKGEPHPTNGNHYLPPSSVDEQHDASSVDDLDFIQLQADIEAQREDIHRIGATGMQIVSNFEAAIVRVEKQMGQLKDSIDSVRKDGQGQRDDVRSFKTELTEVRWECQNNSVLARMDQQLQTTDRVVTELRQAINNAKSDTTEVRDELSTTQQDLEEVKEENERLRQELDEAKHIAQEGFAVSKEYATQHDLEELKGENERLRLEVGESKQIAQEGIAVSKEYASEVSLLRRELKQLRGELAKERAQPQLPDNSSYSSHELDILASSISKIGNRASQVESLQMEFELFRTRVQRLEARTNVSGGARNEPRGSMGDFAAQHQETPQPHHGASARQKRTSSGRDGNQEFGSTPPKRMALSSGFASATTAGYNSIEEWQRSSPSSSTIVVEPPSSRPTKSNSAKKSAAKPRGWKTKS